MTNLVSVSYPPVFLIPRSMVVQQVHYRIPSTSMGLIDVVVSRIFIFVLSAWMGLINTT